MDLLPNLFEANLQYFAELAVKVNDANLTALKEQRQTLFEVLTQGLNSADFQRETAQLILCLSPFADRGGYLREWIPIIETCLTFLSSNDLLHHQLSNQLGLSHILIGELSVALQILTDSQVKLSQLGIDYEAAVAGHYLAMVAYRRNEYAESIARLKEVRAVFGRFPDAKSKLASVDNLLGLIAYEQRRFADAAAHFKMAIEIWKAEKDITYQARAVRNLSRALRANGNYQAALDVLNDNETLLLDSMNELELSRLRLSRGVVLEKMGNWKEAEHAYRQANSAYLQQHGDIQLRAHILHNLAFLKIRRANYEPTLAMLETALELWQQVENHEEYFVTASLLAEAYFQLGKLDQFLTYHRPAWNGLKQFSSNLRASERLSEAHWLDAEALKIEG